MIENALIFMLTMLIKGFILGVGLALIIKEIYKYKIEQLLK